MEPGVNGFGVSYTALETISVGAEIHSIHRPEELEVSPGTADYHPEPTKLVSQITGV